MNEGVLAHTFSECSVKDDYSKSVASKKMWENISDSTKKGYDSKWDMNITEEPKKKDIGKFTRTFSRKATDDKFTKAPLNEVSIFRKMSRQEELQVSESAKKLLKENNVYNESSVAEAESIYDDSSLPFEFVGNDRNEQKSEIQVAQSWIGESNAAKATCCTRVRIRASAIGRSCGEAREKTLTNTFGLPTSLVLPSSAASTARLTSVLPSRSSLSSSSSLLSPAAMPYSGTCVEHGRVWIGYSAANLADGCCDSADKGATENTKTTCFVDPPLAHSHFPSHEYNSDNATCSELSDCISNEMNAHRNTTSQNNHFDNYRLDEMKVKHPLTPFHFMDIYKDSPRNLELGPMNSIKVDDLKLSSQSISSLSWDVDFVMNDCKHSTVVESEKALMLKKWAEEDMEYAKDSVTRKGADNEERAIDISKKRRDLINFQIKEAKQFQKLFGEWVQKTWIVNDDELEMWEYSKKKIEIKEETEFMDEKFEESNDIRGDENTSSEMNNVECEILKDDSIYERISRKWIPYTETEQAKLSNLNNKSDLERFKQFQSQHSNRTNFRLERYYLRGPMKSKSHCNNLRSFEEKRSAGSSIFQSSKILQFTFSDVLPQSFEEKLSLQFDRNQLNISESKFNENGSHLSILTKSFPSTLSNQLNDFRHQLIKFSTPSQHQLLYFQDGSIFSASISEEIVSSHSVTGLRSENFNEHFMSDVVIDKIELNKRFYDPTIRVRKVHRLKRRGVDVDNIVTENSLLLSSIKQAFPICVPFALYCGKFKSHSRSSTFDDSSAFNN